MFEAERAGIKNVHRVMKLVARGPIVRSRNNGNVFDVGPVFERREACRVTDFWRKEAFMSARDGDDMVAALQEHELDILGDPAESLTERSETLAKQLGDSDALKVLKPVDERNIFAPRPGLNF